MEEWFSTRISLPGLRWLWRAAACTSAVTTEEPEPPVEEKAQEPEQNKARKGFRNK